MADAPNDRIGTTSVSADVVETDPIVLRESETRRLVFQPTIVERDQPLRGSFVYQRKAKRPNGRTSAARTFNSLKSGEGWALELHTAEVGALMDGLLARKQLYERHGIRWGEREFIDRESLPQVVRRLVDSRDTELMEALASLQPEAIIALGRKVDLSQLDVLLDSWLENTENNDEGYWQKLLAEHAWVFSQLTGSPVVVLQEQAYVGGKGVDKRGGGEVDFLLRNELTHNVAFVEIKTPGTPICGGAYRTSGAFSMHKELTAASFRCSATATALRRLSTSYAPESDVGEFRASTHGVCSSPAAQLRWVRTKLAASSSSATR